MTNNGGLEKRIRISSYTRRGQLAMESVISVEMEDEDEWLQIKEGVYSNHADMGLTVEIVELTEREWYVFKGEYAFDLPEWGEDECTECIPERIGQN